MAFLAKILHSLCSSVPFRQKKSCFCQIWTDWRSCQVGLLWSYKRVILLIAVRAPATAATAAAATPRPTSAKVLITNLPPTADFGQISSMTTACGNVRTINVRSESNSAVIEFINPESVDLFIRQVHITRGVV